MEWSSIFNWSIFEGGGVRYLHLLLILSCFESLLVLGVLSTS